MLRLCCTAITGLAAILLSSCGSQQAPPQIVPAEGLVLLDGKPLPKAKVRFIPSFEAGQVPTAEGVTDEDGRFKLMCQGQPGAVVGENSVVVMEDNLPPDLSKSSNREKLTAYLASLPNRPIPDRYNNLAKTPLKVQVSPEQSNYVIGLVP